MRVFRGPWGGVRAAALVLVLCIGLAGCPSQEKAPETPDEQRMARLSDISDGKVEVKHDKEVPGLTFVTTYTAPKDIARNWIITKSKLLKIQLSVKPHEGQREVYVEHMHADIFLKAGLAVMDGMQQDVMDDYAHSGTLPGFAVTPEHPYVEHFNIAGYSQFLIEGWTFVTAQGAAYEEIGEKRLTEKNLKGPAQVNGNRIAIIFDVLIKEPGQEVPYKVIISDEFIVPVQP